MLKAFLNAEQPHAWTLTEYDRERPDFVLDGDRRIGVEITEFYLDDGFDSEQVQAKRRNDFICKAKQAYGGTGPMNTAVSVGFDLSTPLERDSAKRTKDLPELLARVVRQNENGRSGEVPWVEYKEIIPEVNFLYLEPRFPDYRDWRICQVHNVSLTERDKVERIVRGKEKLARDYERCDAQWLLICVNVWNPAQEQEIRVDGLQVETSIFERVILFAHPFGGRIDIARPSAR